jgi:hypothetical protein
MATDYLTAQVHSRLKDQAVFIWEKHQNAENQRIYVGNSVESSLDHIQFPHFIKHSHANTHPSANNQKKPMKLRCSNANKKAVISMVILSSNSLFR